MRGLTWWETWIAGAALVGAVAGLAATWLFWVMLTRPVEVARLIATGS